MSHIQCHLLAYLCLAFSLATGLRFYTQPTQFYEYDPNVKLICTDVSHSTGLITNVSRIGIQRLESNGTWIDVADVHQASGVTVHIFKSDITVTGFAGEAAKSQITLSWSVASPDVFGRYRCEAVGSKPGNRIVTERSEPLDARGIREDVSHIYEFIARSDRKVLRYVDEVLSKKLDKQVDVETKQLNSDRVDSFVKLMSDVEAKLNALKSGVGKNLSEVVLTQRGKSDLDTSLWPEGDFSLLMPKSYCPLNPPEWETGFLKLLGKLGSNPTIPGVHMALPSLSADTFYQQFCTLKNSSARQRPWPAGRYCINQNGVACPDGFVRSTLRFPVVRSGANQHYGPVPLQNYSTSLFDINYCCRRDGNVRQPISLPWSKPFYLYRHGSRCQAIASMKEIEDYYLFQNPSAGSWLDSNAAHRPDVALRSDTSKVALCYYAKS